MVFGLVAAGLTLWLGLGWPIGLDRWLDVGEMPAPAEAIICLSGGTATGNLPTDPGWDRIHTATELYADNYAPVIVFSGGGTTRSMSEGEVYADAAAWLGVPREAIVIDAHPRSTAEHPAGLTRLALPGTVRLTRKSRLLVVTSRFHARRALLTFRRAGFTNVRVITRHQSAKATGPIGRHRQGSAVPDYVPSGKRYDDVFNNASHGFRDFFAMLREIAALTWYRWQGWA